MPKSLVQSDLFTPIGPYSHAVIAGDHLFISGTPGIDPSTGQLTGNDVYTQTQQILKNIHSLLASCGAQLDDVTHVQVNLVNVDDFMEMNRAYTEFFNKPYPARTVIGISALPKQGALLTMNATAVIEK